MKKALNTLVFSMSFVTMSSATSSNRPTFSLTFPLPFTSFTNLISRLALAFLTPSMHTSGKTTSLVQLFAEHCLKDKKLSPAILDICKLSPGSATSDAAQLQPLKNVTPYSSTDKCPGFSSAIWFLWLVGEISLCISLGFAEELYWLERCHE